MRLADRLRAAACDPGPGVGGNRGVVEASRDLDRILALPHWVPPMELLEELETLLTRPGAGMRLRAIQVEALAHAFVADGLYASLAVGSGKTLIAALLPTILESERPMICAPPGLVRQGQALIGEYAEHFHVRPDIQWLSYAKLSRAEHADVLEEDLRPDLIVADECHTLARDSARTRRLLRYVRRAEPVFCGLSGTTIKTSIKDAAKLCALALGPRSPLPLHWPEVVAWSEAMDPDGIRRPGALRAFARDSTEKTLDAWRRRAESVGGWVSSGEQSSCEQPLRLSTFEPPLWNDRKASKQAREALNRWEDPFGRELLFQIELGAVEWALKLGGAYEEVWSDSVPSEVRQAWRDARAAWNDVLREALRARRDAWDSPLRIARAVERGELDGLDELNAWREAKAGPCPRSVWRQLDTGPLEAIAVEAAKLEPCVVWLDLEGPARNVADIFSFPLYAAGPKAAEAIDAERGDRTIVATVGAHGVGRNLQQWHRAVVAIRSNAAHTWEQLLGRHHRAGQVRPVSARAMGSLDRVRENARFVEQTTGVAQKVLSAEVVQ